MSLDDASDLLMTVSSALTCCLEMTSSELSDTCCALAFKTLGFLLGSGLLWALDWLGRYRGEVGVLVV